jgi:pimeloyl-ACP methyl ester carboxylesterase
MSQRSLSPPKLEVPGSSSGGGHGLYALDPRSSSTQSLAPSLPEDGDPARRKLLLIYVHGYMGNDRSFQSFPSHVHHYLKTALAETHVIHSKIYPRYKTYKHLEVARDNFSRWLEPHESPTTDVVLVGHSMGGLLAAEVVLMVRAERRTAQKLPSQLTLAP